MNLLTGTGASKWNINTLRSSPAVKGAIRSLNGKVPVPNIFHSKLISNLELHFASGRSAFARVWSISKPQKTHFLDANELHALLQ